MTNSSKTTETTYLGIPWSYNYLDIAAIPKDSQLTQANPSWNNGDWEADLVSHWKTWQQLQYQASIIPDPPTLPSSQYGSQGRLYDSFPSGVLLFLIQSLRNIRCQTYLEKNIHL
ncbi:hypothetical protein HMI56_000011 [Coelomomyces lativittatus]|nr:hypothetical protein HMI56_000011 [Coelomomyces lativittatus]